MHESAWLPGIPAVAGERTDERTGPEPWFWPAVVSTLIASALLVLLIGTILSSDLGARLGLDYRIYMDATRTWLAGGAFYPAWQLQGAFGISSLPVLYPPYALALFVPFTMLPAFLWWAIPMAMIVFGLRTARPHRWAWPILVFGVLYPNTIWLFIAGNPVMWVIAALSFGLRWPAIFVLLKPSLAPFALVGARSRWWWVGVAGAIVLTIATAQMWPDYIATLLHFQSDRGITYSITDVPVVLVPLVAWMSTLRDVDQGPTRTT